MLNQIDMNIRNYIYFLFVLKIIIAI